MGIFARQPFPHLLLRVKEMPITELMQSAIVVSLLLVVTLCAITDVLEHRIPNAVLLPALVLAFLLNGLLAGFGGLLDCALGLVLGFVMLYPMYFVGGTSPGDVKLLAVVGALLGTNGAFIAGVATLVVGGVLGVLFIAWRLIEPLIAAQITQILRTNGTASPPLYRAFTRDETWRSEFPYAPAIACGTYYTIWHLGYFGPVLGN